MKDGKKKGHSKYLALFTRPQTPTVTLTHSLHSHSHSHVHMHPHRHVHTHSHAHRHVYTHSHIHTHCMFTLPTHGLFLSLLYPFHFLQPTLLISSRFLSFLLYDILILLILSQSTLITAAVLILQAFTPYTSSLPPSLT